MAFSLTSVGSFSCSVDEPIYESCCLNTGGNPILLLRFESGLIETKYVSRNDSSFGHGNPLLSSMSIRKSILKIKQFKILISPYGLLWILHRTVHFRSSLIETYCIDHSHVVLFLYAQYHPMKEQHQLVVSKVVANV